VVKCGFGKYISLLAIDINSVVLFRIKEIHFYFQLTVKWQEQMNMARNTKKQVLQ